MRDIVDALMDFSFKKFITPKIAKVVYMLSMVAALLVALMIIRTGGIGIILAPVVFVMIVVSARVFIEVSLSLFQIARYTGEVARRGRPDRTWRYVRGRSAGAPFRPVDAEARDAAERRFSVNVE